MLRPHHISIVQRPFKYEDHLWMIPELLQEVEDPEMLAQYSDFLLNCSGLPVEYGYQFVVKDKYFFERLSQSDFISYLIAADDGYFEELPLFFEDQWDSKFLLDEMFILGWTVNKYTEPAVLFGIFPIIKEGERYIIKDANMINKWGLIGNQNDAKKIAQINTNLDSDNETWRALAVYVDKFSFNRLNSYK